jgi:purine nucleoside permease
MKRIARCALAALGLATSLATHAAEPRPLKVLIITMFGPEAQPGIEPFGV